MRKDVTATEPTGGTTIGKRENRTATAIAERRAFTERHDLFETVEGGQGAFLWSKPIEAVNDCFGFRFATFDDYALAVGFTEALPNLTVKRARAEPTAGSVYFSARRCR